MVLAHFAASGSGVLNVPSWALAYAVFAVSVIVILVSRSRHVPRPRPGLADAGPQERHGPTIGLVRLALGVVLVVLAGFCWFGPTGITSNIAPLALVGVLWPLGGWVALVAGWCWQTLDPFVGLARIGDRRRLARSATTARVPTWAPVPVFATWVVVWVAWIRGDEPRNLAVWLTAYLVAMTVVSLVGGTVALRAANPLPVALDFTAAILRPRRAEARTTRPEQRRALAVVAAMTMGALGANRIADTGWFTSWFTDAEASTTTLAILVAFALIAMFVGAVWRACGAVVERARGEGSTHRISGALAPVAGGLLLAQGLPVGLVAAQNLAIVASDPFGRGWDVFGTVYWQVEADPLSGFTLGLIQTGAILIGLSAGLVMVGRAATSRGADGTTTAAARNRAWTAALPAMTVLGVGGVVWTLLLVGR